jgi:hypothetical protein
MVATRCTENIDFLFSIPNTALLPGAMETPKDSSGAFTLGYFVKRDSTKGIRQLVVLGPVS